MKFSYQIILLLFILICSNTQSTATVPTVSLLEITNKLRDAIMESIELKKWEKSKKIIASLGGISGYFKDTSGLSAIKGNNKTGMAVLGYQFSPKISASVAYAKSVSSGMSGDGSLTSKTNDDIVAATVDYKLKSWLNVAFSIAQDYGRSTTIMPTAINPNSVSNYVNTTPTAMFRMTIPLSKRIMFLPDGGLSRTFNHVKPFNDISSSSQPPQHNHLDQAFVNTKFGYMVHPLAIPYVSAGYTNALHSDAFIKSRHSTRIGGGVLILGGLFLVEYTNQKFLGQYREQQIKLNCNMRF